MATQDCGYAFYTIRSRGPLIYDPVGNSGKTYLSNVLEFKHNYQSFAGGKLADLAYATDGDRDGYIIDLARCSEEFCCYNFMEQLKNRRIFSTKYDSGTKYLRSEGWSYFQTIFPTPPSFPEIDGEF